MLTFMNSKLPDDWQISDKQYHIFQKDFKCFTGAVIYFMLANVIKTSNLIKVISSYNICSIIKCQQAKKTCDSLPKTFDFFQNSSVPFHYVIFDHPVSCKFLIDKQNENCKNSKKFETNTLSTRKLLKRNQNITPAKTNALIS